MADKVAQYVLSLGGDDADLRSLFSGVKSRLRSDVAEMKQIADRLDLFGDLQNSLPGVQRSLDSAKAKVKEFTDAVDKIKGTGGKPTKELVDGLKDAEKAVASASKEFNTQTQKLNELQAQLTKAGVNTKALAAEQIRLAEASKVATDAATVMAAKQALGLKTLQDIAPEVARLKAAFEALKASGTASVNEIAAAEGLLNTKIKELNATVTQTGGAFKASFFDGKQTLSSLIGPIVAAAAAFGGFGAAVTSAVVAGLEYEKALHAINAETVATKQQSEALGAETRRLAVAFGVDLGEALKGVKDLIRSGISPDNAIEALRVSAVAAQAAMVSLGTGVAATNVLVSAFGIPVKDLGRALDVVTVSAKNGGPTLTEFASSAGNLGVVARAVHADFNEVTAALNVMTNATGDAGGSADALSKILVQLGSDSVQKKLRDLGIAGLGVAETFAKLGEKGLNINEFLALGLANTKAAVGVAALKEAAKDLPRILDELGKSAGASAKEAEKFYNTTQARVDRLKASYRDLEVQLAQNSVGVGALSNNVNTLLNTLKNLSLVDLALFYADGAAGINNLKLKFDEVAASSDKARTNAIQFGVDTGDQVSRLAERLARFAADNEAAIQTALSQLRTDSAELLQLAEKIRAVGSEGIAEINLRATAEIEAINRTIEARKVALQQQEDNLRAFRDIVDLDTTAAITAQIKAQESGRIAIAAAQAQIIAIEQNAAAQRLKIIQDTEAKVTEAINEAFKARRIEAGTNQAKLKELDEEEGKVRTASIAKSLASYREYYKDLIGQSRTYIDKIKSIEGERVSFNKTIQDAIREVQNRSLSGADAYGEKLVQIEELIDRATKARLNGNRDLERTYTNEAIAGARSLGEVIDKTGKVVVTQQKAQADSLGLLDKIQDQYNDSLDEQETAATKGAKATQTGLNAVKPIIEDLQKKLDGLIESTSKGIQLKINDDIAGLKEATKKLDDLVLKRVAVVEVQYVTPAGAPASAPSGGSGGGSSPDLGTNFGRGGSVWRRYAGGGTVFRAPSWSKVPGSGNGDTVPALLPVGSFVMRRAASEKYGDGVMSRLARGYAYGGYAGPSGSYSGPNDPRRALPRADPTGPPQSITTPDVTPTPSASDAVTYARAIAAYLRPFGPLQNLKEGIGRDIKALDRNPRSVSLIQQLIRAARIAAANNHLENYWMASTMGGGAFQTYNDLPDWYDFMAQKSTGQGYARGGPVGTDTVPAWLTPREWVLTPPAVQRIAAMFGGGFLPAMNRMEVPAPPAPRYFKQGGPVGPTPPSSSSWSGAGSRMGATYNITINAAGNDIMDPSVQRKLRYALNQQDRRAGK